MSKTHEPVLYRNAKELTDLRARIAQSDHELAAGLGIDITDVDSDEFAEQIMQDAERRHPEIKNLGRDRDADR